MDLLIKINIVNKTNATVIIFHSIPMQISIKFRNFSMRNPIFVTIINRNKKLLIRTEQLTKDTFLYTYKIIIKYYLLITKPSNSSSYYYNWLFIRTLWLFPDISLNLFKQIPSISMTCLNMMKIMKRVISNYLHAWSYDLDVMYNVHDA